MNTNKVYDCTIIELDKHHSDRKGNLTVVENNKEIPFEVKRTYYLYDVPGGESRNRDGFIVSSRKCSPVFPINARKALVSGAVHRAFLPPLSAHCPRR